MGIPTWAPQPDAPAYQEISGLYLSPWEVLASAPRLLHTPQTPAGTPRQTLGEERGLWFSCRGGEHGGEDHVGTPPGPRPGAGTGRSQGPQACTLRPFREHRPAPQPQDQPCSWWPWLSPKPLQGYQLRSQTAVFPTPWTVRGETSCQSSKP